MPWCGTCRRYFTPTALDAGGDCPDCGTPAEAADLAPSGEAPGGEDVRPPWHFWAVVVATAVYVGWRIVQLVSGAL